MRGAYLEDSFHKKSRIAEVIQWWGGTFGIQTSLLCQKIFEHFPFLVSSFLDFGVETDTSAQ